MKTVVVVRMSTRFSVDSVVGLQVVRSSPDFRLATEKRKSVDRAFVHDPDFDPKDTLYCYLRPVSSEDYLIAVLYRVLCDEISLPTYPPNHVKAIYTRNSPLSARFPLGLLGVRRWAFIHEHHVLSSPQTLGALRRQ